MYIKVQEVSNIAAARGRSGQCPFCNHKIIYEPIDENDLVINRGEARAGQSRCSNPQCYGHIFWIANNDGTVICYPPAKIDFDKTGIPEEVLAAFEEAITSHANECHVAAGMLIRKTLEELCADKGAEGGDLKKRIEALGDKITISKELLDGVDLLRVLGNDAAHVESRVFEEVGKEEIETGIEFAKEILKATYQYSSLLEKLNNLKKLEKGTGK